MINVNLLPPKHVFSQKEREIRKKILIFTLGLSVAFVVLFGGLYGTSFFYTARLAALDQEQRSYQDQLSEYSQLGWNVRSIALKLAGIKLIRDNQIKFSVPLAHVRQLTEGIVDVNHFDLLSDYKLTFSGQTETQADLTAFLNKFSNRDPEVDFLQKVTLQDLQQQESFKFGFLIGGEYVEVK